MLKYLGIRSNLINEKGFEYFFEKCLLKNKSKIEYLYCNKNNISDHLLLDLYQKLSD